MLVTVAVSRIKQLLLCAFFILSFIESISNYVKF